MVTATSTTNTGTTPTMATTTEVTTATTEVQHEPGETLLGYLVDRPLAQRQSSRGTKRKPLLA